MIYPHNFESKIGFDQIRELLKRKCLSTLGADKVNEMTFLTDFNVIDEKLEQTNEFLRILQEKQAFPDEHFFDVRESLKRIRIEGMYLDEEELFDLMRSLDTIVQIVKFFHIIPEDSEEDSLPYPSLAKLTEEVSTYPKVVKTIDRLVDKYGKVKDNATAELMRIRRELARTTGGISKLLNSILRGAKSEGLIDKDASPTVRDGRLVIPIAPGLKRKMKGIVHDESATGKTVFIEPAEVVEANNRIRELENDERKEIIRILRAFSGKLRPLVPEILNSYQFLAEIDFIRAKAKLANNTNSIRPVLYNKPHILWTTAVHPLLERALNKQNKKVVPLDIELNQKDRILIISGPNAGGKSVCLKTVGLLQYMAQSGLLIPLHESSELGIFHSIMMDIGDEQSIEDDLSTYSSHLTNMKEMVRNCNANSLLLIDEFGGGTEPQIGGAIAESLLKKFNEQQTFGVITTHYQNLKLYAEDTPGIVNGAMLYDRHHMQALFKLEIGNPGSSFAVEIARKIGLPEEIINGASEIVGAEYINADKYLQDIVRDKQYWERKRRSIRRQEKQMESTIERYTKQMESLNKERKSIIAQSKEEAERILQESNSKIENTIRIIKESQAERDKTREARQDLADFRAQLDKAEKIRENDKITSKMESLRAKQERRQNRRKEAPVKKAPTPVQPKKSTEIEVGSKVRIKGQRTIGEVIEINGKEAIVLFGQMKTSTKLNRLETTQDTPKKTKSSNYISGQTTEQMHEKKLNFKQDIDVRGMRGDEALQAVTYFIDDAILIGVNRVTILHGTGTGILRTLIRDYLATVPGVSDFRDEHIQLGGAGITVVELY